MSKHAAASPTWATVARALEPLGGDPSVYDRETIEYWLRQGASVPWILSEILQYEVVTFTVVSGQRKDDPPAA